MPAVVVQNITSDGVQYEIVGEEYSCQAPAIEHPIVRRAMEKQKQLDSSLFIFHESERSAKEALVLYDALIDLEQVEDELKHSDAPFSQVQEAVATLQAAREGVFGHVEAESKLVTVKKWIEAGYDRTLIETDPKGVEFLVETGLLSTLKMYDEQKELLKGESVGFAVQAGTIHLKVEGKLTPWDQIKKNISYDPVEKKFIGWTFVHPKGFHPVDSLEWTTLSSLAELRDEALQSVRSQAEKFWKNHPEIDPGKEKKCVLQVVSTKGHSSFSGIVGTGHTHIRLIDEEGHVYSLGTKLKREEGEYVFSQGIGVSLRTADAKLVSPDFLESAACAHQDMISVPIALERFLAIKETVEQINAKGGIRFCASKHNCCRFAQDMLKLAGVNGVDIATSGPSFIYRLLPDFSSFPLIGKPIVTVAQAICVTARTIFDISISIMPKPIKKAIAWVQEAVSYVPKKLATLCANLLCLALGASQSKPSRIASNRFQQLMGSVFDLFKEESSTVYDSTLLVKWMKKQGSYQAYDNRYSGLVITSSQTESTPTESSFKQRFRKYTVDKNYNVTRTEPDGTTTLIQNGQEFLDTADLSGCVTISRDHVEGTLFRPTLIHTLIAIFQTIHVVLTGRKEKADPDYVHASVILRQGKKTPTRLHPFLVAHADGGGIRTTDWDALQDKEVTEIVIYQPVDDELRKIIKETAERNAFVDDERFRTSHSPKDKAYVDPFETLSSLAFNEPHHACGKHHPISSRSKYRTASILADNMLHKQFSTASGKPMNFFCTPFATAVFVTSLFELRLKTLRDEERRAFLLDGEGHPLAREALIQKIQRSFDQDTPEDGVAHVIHDVFTTDKLARLDTQYLMSAYAVKLFEKRSYRAQK